MLDAFFHPQRQAPDRTDCAPNSRALRRLNALSAEEWNLLWYVYNRGGVANRDTLKWWFPHLKATAIHARLIRLQEQGWLQRLFDDSAYRHPQLAGPRPFLYRVTSAFLSGVGDADSHIRKLRSFSRAVALVGLTNALLMGPLNELRLAPRRQRVAAMLAAGMDMADLPRYFVRSKGKNADAVVSVNHELAQGQDGQISVVFYPQTADAHDFARAMGKYRKAFTGPDWRVLAISVNAQTEKMFSALVQASQYVASSGSSPKARDPVALIDAARGSLSHQVQYPPTKQPGVPSPLQPFPLWTVHQPLTWQRYYGDA